MNSRFSPLVLLPLLVAALALLAPWLAPQNPYDLAALDILDARLPPGSHASSSAFVYWLGSDEQGRDLLSALLYGLRISLLVSIAGSGIAFVIGGLLGLWSALRPGLFDRLLAAAIDLQLSFPTLLVALVLLAVLGPGLDKVALALALSQWAWFARTARSLARTEAGRDYVAAARLFGVSTGGLFLRHLLPNCLPPLLMTLPVQLAAAIGLEATLSFLGLGAPVTEPSLGLLIANGFQYLLSGKYWISLFPGLALVLAVAACQLLSDRFGEMTSS